MKGYSVLRQLKIFMLGFGIIMGIVFPLYANFFVHWKEGMLKYFILGSLVAGITVGLVSFLFVRLILINKLNEVSEIAANVEQKDITGTIRFSSDDQVGVIVLGLNSILLNIRNLFSDMAQVFSLSESILQNVGAGNKSNSQSSIEEIKESIHQVHQKAVQIKQLSDDIITTVQKGKQIAECTYEKQKGAIQNLELFSSIMSSLVKHSADISHILVIIQDISSQTNILSLNASVEAARAGEYGKGFAVVAGEIRKLANSTNESSQIISNTVSYIKNDVDKALKSLNKLVDEANENNGHVLSINKQFTKIDHAIHANMLQTQELEQSVNHLNQHSSKILEVFNQLNGLLIELQNNVESYKY